MMFKKIFEKLREWSRPPLSPKNPKARQELLKIFLAEFGQTLVPGSQKTLSRTELTWEQDSRGQWHLISPFVSPEMRRKFPFLRLRRPHPPIEQPNEKPPLAPPHESLDRSKHRPPRIIPTQTRPASEMLIRTEVIRPPEDESLKRTVVRWNRLNAADNVDCPFCGTVNEKVKGPGTKKCFSCGKYFGAV